MYVNERCLLTDVRLEVRGGGVGGIGNEGGGARRLEEEEVVVVFTRENRGGSSQHATFADANTQADASRVSYMLLCRDSRMHKTSRATRSRVSKLSCWST